MYLQYLAVTQLIILKTRCQVSANPETNERANQGETLKPETKASTHFSLSIELIRYSLDEASLFQKITKFLNFRHFKL